MKDFNVLFTYALWPHEKQWGRFKKGAGNNSFSYGLASIVGVAEKGGFSISVCDSQVERMSESEFSEYLNKGKFDVIGLSCYTASTAYVFHTAKICKKVLPQSKIIVGGIHPTILPEETLNSCKEIDAVVIGEGEYTVLELLKYYRDGEGSLENIEGIGFRLNDEVIKTPRRPLIKNLDELPMPAYHLFPMEKYIPQPTVVKRYPTFTILASRGCPYSCSFCHANEVHGKKVRYKSVSQVLKEIKYLKDNFGAKGIAFSDSTLTVNKRWVTELCDAFVKEHLDIEWMCYSRVDTIDKDLLLKMRSSGCWAISFGVESGIQKSLDLICKGTTVEQNVKSVKDAIDLGFFVTATYIIGLPGEDEKDAKTTIQFAKQLGTHIAIFFLPVPFPKTTLYETCLLDKGVRLDATWDDYNVTDFSNPLYVNPLLGKDKMTELVRYAVRSYYLQPTVIMRNLVQIKSIDDIKKYWFAARSIFGK
ncbi:B12-binding domain-containing radical SAM protein [Chloroflexota bacterium]